MFFNVYLCLLLLFHIEYSVSWKRNWPRFSLPQLCPINIYVIAIVKICNRPIQNLFNCSLWTFMDYCKLKSLPRIYLLYLFNFQKVALFLEALFNFWFRQRKNIALLEKKNTSAKLNGFHESPSYTTELPLTEWEVGESVKQDRMWSFMSIYLARCICTNHWNISSLLFEIPFPTSLIR